MVGAAAASRPLYWPCLPLIFSLAGWRVSRWAAPIWTALVGASVAHGWVPGRLLVEWSRETSAIMLALSCLAAWRLDQAGRWLALAAILALPGLWASQHAPHLILALPALLVAKQHIGFYLRSKNRGARRRP
jgi:hypothetical protein